MAETIETPITKLLRIKYPILLAGMNVAAGPELAAAVTNAGGLGVIGGIGYTPKFLKLQIDLLKKGLTDKNAPFGVDLLLPQVGGSARKTNYDYTKGELPELLDVIIASKASLFVSAVGVPPKWAVEKLHAAGIIVMNMVGAPKHALKAIEVGVDIICAQGGEGGGHTGDIPTSILIPAVVDAVRGKKSPFTGQQIPVIAAGGIVDGRGLAMSLSLGADAVWVGTRFVASVEAGAPKAHKEGVVGAGFDDVIRTIIYTGRPMHVLKTDFLKEWEENRQADIKKLASEGTVPIMALMAEKIDKGEITLEKATAHRPWLMGRAAALIKEVKPAKVIIDEIMHEAVAVLRRGSSLVKPVSKL